MKEGSPSIETIDAYVAQFTPDIQVILQKIRLIIREAAPEAKEKISYQMPTFELHGNLVHFAAFKNHIGFYPTPSGVEAFEAELAPYVTAKGSIQFPLNQPMPYDLIEKIVHFRINENQRQAEAKKAKKKK